MSNKVLLIGGAIAVLFLMSKKKGGVVRTKPIATPAVSAPVSQPSFQDQATQALQSFAVAEAPRAFNAIGNALGNALSSDDFGD